MASRSRTPSNVRNESNGRSLSLPRPRTARSSLSRSGTPRLSEDPKRSSFIEPRIEIEEIVREDAPASKPHRAESMLEETLGTAHSPASTVPAEDLPYWRRCLRRTGQVLVKYAKFIGPGFMISVAYIDPGNYATDISAGASNRFTLLFMVLLSNIFAIFLQSLSIKLGSVTGLNLAEMCRAHLPPWLNYTLYFFAEAAIIVTDLAEVIGTAIALYLLLHIPLVAGVAISILDVLFILIFYRSGGQSMKALRAFEFFVMLLVIGVVVCFCFQLSLIKGVPVGEVFKGYLPSSALVQGSGLYQACGILGATVMPHSLYLGSGIVQARLKDFDTTNHTDAARSSSTTTDSKVAVVQVSVKADPDAEADEKADADCVVEKPYRPSVAAIRSCMSYSIAELAISLFTFALFVNSAILIVAGSSLNTVEGADNASLFAIFHLLSHQLAPAAGIVFALALLLSGTSAGIVCTIAGQMVSEGQLTLKIKPWQRRLLTRSISITPSIIIAGAVGAQGLSTALVASQVALSVILPITSAPLIYFTCRNKYMTVAVAPAELPAVVVVSADEKVVDVTVTERAVEPAAGVKMRNHWLTTVFAVLIWGVIVIMNVALIVLLALGVS